MMRNIFKVLIALCCVALFHQSQVAQAQSLRINGTAVGIGGRLAGTRSFSLIVNRYTAPNEVKELTDALARGGQDELVKTLSKIEVGRIIVGNGVGVTANAILVDPWRNGGTKLTVIYRRTINFYELRYGTRSTDYPIGYAEIFLDSKGKGQGTLISAAKVRLRDNNTWEVEDFGTFPARLMGLRTSGKVLPR